MTEGGLGLILRLSLFLLLLGAFDVFKFGKESIHINLDAILMLNRGRVNRGATVGVLFELFFDIVAGHGSRMNVQLLCCWILYFLEHLISVL